MGVAPYVQTLCVSIHAPWEGCDAASVDLRKWKLRFQFTHPGKGATFPYLFPSSSPCVSIHAPWEGCDRIVDANRATLDLVSIHAPWEGCDSVLQSCVL